MSYPETCSCGAQLPPEAVFCHKCGKPQRDVGPVEPEPRPVEAAPPLFLPVPPETPPLSFRNPIALRIAAMVAVGATFLSFLPYLNWLAAGYFAVFFYRRRTGSGLNLLIGLRMGWITGVLMFGLTVLVIAAAVLLVNASGGLDVVQLQFKNMADPRVQEMFKILRSRSDLAMLMAQLFVFITCLSMAGGALAAKLVGRS
ncbi:MAG TPA: zinc ribbon domain-containing protein [Bryobacteraceae bacterium]|nr:zinc ribbon domain-containing protein [Bryobacteraceae bacterium]